MARRKYDPEPVEKYIQRVPIWGNHWNKNQYVPAVTCRRLGKVVDLRGIDPLHKEMLGLMDVKVHDMHLEPGYSFSEEGKARMMEAAKILNEQIENRIPTAVTCEMGIGRTGRVLYLLHRIRGASHDDAVIHSNPSRDDIKRLKEVWEKRAKFKS